MPEHFLPTGEHFLGFYVGKDTFFMVECNSQQGRNVPYAFRDAVAGGGSDFRVGGSQRLMAHNDVILYHNHSIKMSKHSKTGLNI